jgi:ADP-heptose:LPS heptosyltransferase
MRGAARTVGGAAGAGERREAGRGRDEARGRDPWRRLRRGARGALLRALSLGAGAGDAPLPDLRALRRILLVSVSQRLGNTVLATAGVAALERALPEAELGFVGGSPAPALLEGFRLARVHALDRADPFLPWRLARLVAALRRERYDAAIHLGTATGSLGAFLVAASGAPHRIGVRRRDGNVFFTTAVEPPSARHKVDALLEYVRSLGVEALGERTLAFTAAERAEAARFLREALGVEARAAAPAGGAGELSGAERGAGPRAPCAPGPVALFVGSRVRKGKVWPLGCYAHVAEGLRARGVPTLVFLGPEERASEAEIRGALGAAHYLFEPDLRRVAAIVGACRAALAPDAGPMHLAIASGAPTLAVFVRANFDRWGPRPPRGDVVYDPEGARAGQALEALLRLAEGGGA